MRRDAVASPNACGIAHHRRARRHVPRDHTARSDDGNVSDTHPRQDEGAAADPDIAPDLDRAAELEPGRPLREAARILGRPDFHSRAVLFLFPLSAVLLSCYYFFFSFFFFFFS